MRNAILGAAVLLGLLMCAAMAQAQQVAAPVVEQLSSSFTCQGVAVSSASATSVATQVIPSTNTLWRQMELENLEASQATYCSDSVNVSTITTNALVGHKLFTLAATNAPWSTPIVPGQLFYCLCDKSGGTCALSICLKR